MSTAQVSIELVLAGILALCAFFLPFVAGTEVSEDLLQSNALIGVLGVAYLLGVVFDKLSDSILGPFEKIKRLRIADEYMSKHPRYKGDPFPQNVLEFRLRQADDGRLGWMDSLKSRIRTSRELAVLGLPATMGIALYQGLSTKCVGLGPCPERWLYLFVGVNVILIFVAAWRSTASLNIPKTDELSKDPDERKKELANAERGKNAGSLIYYLILFNSALAILTLSILLPGQWRLGLFGVGGAAVTVLGLWAWHNITGTYLKFVAREMPNLRKEKK